MEPSLSAILDDTVRDTEKCGVFLMVMNGPEDGRVFRITANPASLGRLEANHIVLALDPTISRRHAQISEDRGAYYLEDLDSRHGTELEGVKIVGKTELRDGNLIQIGETRLQFEIVPGAEVGGSSHTA
jgi:pSer/pThr/pTyr-binding forkhead associated (FHA) protein